MTKTLNILDKNISYNSVDDKDILLLIHTVKTGIKFAIFNSIANSSPFTLNEWSNFLHLSERTMQRYKRQKKTFDALHSEKIVEIALLYKLGVDVFGNKEKFNSWLETENLALGKMKPKTLLDNSFGIGLLRDELTRIEYGVLA
jgi:putative toxin-antitoxin system antitoxin component (TIGR02293 family)